MSNNDAIRDMRQKIDQLESQLEHIRRQVDYWSYCTRQGMLRECPELADELTEFFSECGVKP